MRKEKNSNFHSIKNGQVKKRKIITLKKTEKKKRKKRKKKRKV